MEPDSFRKLGYQVIDWIADYLENGYDGPVAPDTSPGDVLAMLPASPPVHAEPGEAVLKDFHQIITPNITHWNDPRFFAYFPANHSGPGILGDLLSAGLGVNAMSWATSPAATELEVLMMRWLGQMLDLDWPGCIQDTASTGTLCGVLSAREACSTVNHEGFYERPPMTVYTSEHANSVVLKAIRIAGFGDRYLRIVPCREDYSMDPAALQERIDADIAAGLKPCVVVPTVGTTSSTAVDPIAEIAAICKPHKIWVHVDAAMAGSAAILPEFRWLMDGVADCDSFVFNPHKWLFTNFDCSAYFCKDATLLKRALAISANYLKTDQDGVAENFREWGIQLGRRFRALKLWFVIRAYGVSGLQEKIRTHIRMAKWLGQQVAAHPRMHLIVEPTLNTVCFRLESDEASEALLRGINATGRAFLMQTRLNDHYIVRISFGQTHSRFEHAEMLWDVILETLENV